MARSLALASAEATHIADTSAPEPVDRRREGFAGVAGDLLTSGATVLVAVADVPRRRAALEAIVAGLAPEGMPVASWAAVAAAPDLARQFDHLVALDPPPRGVADPLLRAGLRAHLAWGPAEAEFALKVWRAELDLRPALTDAYRSLRELPPDADPDAIQAALAGSGRYPRTPECCARLVLVLAELALIEFAADPPRCRVLAGARNELERSSTYRASAARLEAIERALGPELGVPARARAA